MTSDISVDLARLKALKTSDGYVSALLDAAPRLIEEIEFLRASELYSKKLIKELSQKAERLSGPLTDVLLRAAASAPLVEYFKDLSEEQRETVIVGLETTASDSFGADAQYRCLGEVSL